MPGVYNVMFAVDFVRLDVNEIWKFHAGRKHRLKVSLLKMELAQAFSTPCRQHHLSFLAPKW
jgi:hypothetical protein